MIPRRFDVAGVDTDAVDGVLATTRSVRRRLDLTRDVPDELIGELIDLAEQAPTGGNQSSRRWMVVRRPDVKERIAAEYRTAGSFILEQRDRLAGTGHPAERTVASAAHLVEHLAEVPVIVIPTIWGVHDGSGRPGLFDSVIQAAWSFCLAARARGLGTAWTTLHLARASEVAAILGIPDGVTQIALLPVAWTVGTDFAAAPRRPAAEITWWDRWGHTWERRPTGTPTLADGPGAVAEIDVDAPPAVVWELISDPAVPARFSEELIEARWADGDTPGPGARIIGRNRHPAVGEWETTSYVTVWEPPRRLGWAVSDPENPGARWMFEVDELVGGRSRLRQSVRMGPGPSGLSMALASMPEAAARIISRRQDEHLTNMTRTIQGIAELAAERHRAG